MLRSSLRQSAQAEISGMSLRGSTALPVFLSVAEAISLLAYGKLTTLDGPAPGAPNMYQRWGVHVTAPHADERDYPLVHRMRLVLARARWWRDQKRKKSIPAKCAPALAPEHREEVRRAIRRYGVSAVQTLALLREDVRQLLAAQAKRQIGPHGYSVQRLAQNA